MSEFTLTFGIKKAQTAVNISMAEKMIFRLFTIKPVSLFISTPPELLLTNHCIYSIITIRYKVNILFIIKKFDANTTERLWHEINKSETFVNRKESVWKTKECG